MKYRTAVVLDRTDVGASGTKVVDINLRDVISRLWVTFRATCPTTPALTDHPAKAISKIEIVNGSDVLYALDGLESQALDFYDSGRDRHDNGSLATAWTNVCNFYINFGRKLWDTMLAFDPKRFDNPQIKITFDEDAGITSVVANELGIVADCFDEKAVSPLGFLMAKEHFQYAPTANGWEYIDLPSDFPIRKVMLGGRLANFWVGSMWDTFKLSEDNDKKVPFSLESEFFETWLSHNFGHYVEHWATDLDATTGQRIYSCPTQGLVFSGNCYVSSGFTGAVPMGYSNLVITQDNIAIQSIDVVGDVPHGFFCIPMGDQDDLDDWWDVVGKKVQLQIKAGANVASNAYIALEQLRRY